MAGTFTIAQRHAPRRAVVARGATRSVARDWLVVSSSTLVAQGLGVVTSFLLRWLLDPAQAGIWQGLKLALSYSNYANLGASKAATREAAMACGRGDTGAAAGPLRLAHTINTVSSLVCAAVLLAAALYVGLRQAGAWSTTWAVGLACMAGLVVVQRRSTYFISILRAQQQFAATARITLAEAILTLIATALGVWLFGLPGLYAATLLVLLAALILAGRLVHLPPGPAWDWSEARRLVAIGGPLLIAGAAWSLFRGLDKLAILAWCADREYQLGCYSLALMVAGQVFGLGNMLSVVLWPRYAAAFARDGRRAVARLAAQSAVWQSAVAATCAALAIVTAPAILGRLLAEYRDGLPALGGLLPGTVALCAALPAGGYTAAVNAPRRLLAAMLPAGLLAVGGNAWALSGGGGLPALAVTTSLAYALFFVLGAALTYGPQLRAAEAFHTGVRLAVAALPTLIAAGAAEYFWPGLSLPLAAVVPKAAAIGLLALLCASWAARPRPLGPGESAA